jgi:hypothetical protein
MPHHKRKGPKSTRAGVCGHKSHKWPGADVPTRQEQRGRDSEQYYYEEQFHHETQYYHGADPAYDSPKRCSHPQGHFEDNQGYCHCCGIAMNPAAMAAWSGPTEPVVESVISPDQFLYVGDRYVWSVPRIKRAWTQARQAFTRAIRSGGFRKLVLLMGVPASGKSTWLGESQEAGTLYLNACFDLPWKRKPFIKEAQAAGLEVEIMWFDTPLEVCLERNAERSEDRRVPAEVVEAMHAKIHSAPPDAHAEGVLVSKI